MPKRIGCVWAARIVVIAAVAAFIVSWPSQGTAIASTVTFETTDQPGGWFDCSASPGGVCVTFGNEKSLAVIHPGDTVAVQSTGQASTLHTFVSLIYPTAAANMPFDIDLTNPSTFSVTLTTPGLYVFFCDIHPYMFAAVIVDDTTTTGLDLGETVDLINGITGLPTSSDLAKRLLKSFFIITNPDYWQDHSPVTNPSGTWTVAFPPVDVRVTGGAVINLSALNISASPLPPLVSPLTPGVGEVWVDTQLEKTSGKTKPGTATAVDATSWKVTRKVALPSINMNNPHNMWTDRHQNVIYQTQWFDDRLTTFDRKTGALVSDIVVGPVAAHVMTRVDTDQVHVTLQGGNDVAELQPVPTSSADIVRNIPMGGPTETTHPHGHWMSHDGETMVTPNSDTGDSTDYCFTRDKIVSKTPTGNLSIAVGMAPDASKYYVANFLDSTISVFGLKKDRGCRVVSSTGQINLLANYNPITGAITGPIGGLPIQTPFSPNGKYAVGANTLTASISIIDTSTDTLVKTLPCDPGCHGVQFGAKKGGGYYAYVSSKFSNELIIVDPDPDGDGNPSDAVIVGRVLLTTDNQALSYQSDDTVNGYAGMGGQGVLAIPVVYNGWVQRLPGDWKAKLTPAQRNPIPSLRP